MDARIETARVWQPVVCGGLLAGILGSGVALMAAVRSERLGVAMDEWSVSVNETANEYSRQFLDTEDRVVLKDLVELDPSSGGVYFFGASNIKWAMRVPDLPPAERRLIHNFGGGEGWPYFHRQFTDYLIESKGILRAGPEKTLVVYGACFLNARRAQESPRTYFPNLWRRYGLYRYDFDGGIEPIALGRLHRAYLLTKAREMSMVQGLIERAGRLFVPKAFRRRRGVDAPELMTADYARRLGPDWRDELAAHRRELQAWYDSLHVRKVAFVVVLLPLASWHRSLPYPPAYRAMIEEFCKTNHVRLIDLSELLEDDEFLDHIHVNKRGLEKTDAALLGVARDFLSRPSSRRNKTRVK